MTGSPSSKMTSVESAYLKRCLHLCRSCEVGLKQEKKIVKKWQSLECSVTHVDRCPYQLLEYKTSII